MGGVIYFVVAESSVVHLAIGLVVVRLLIHRGTLFLQTFLLSPVPLKEGNGCIKLSLIINLRLLISLAQYESV